ncbi:hypothetical protein [Neosynechococcus sphagnicola]|uniref:hypothetical protein n=1 Tax=Neosynechococcus sphagnicola TaxID=1501145 RepID=UPI000689F524|nr:hypothetical protein [Neosynechococcus sphagnicola]
MHETLEAAYNSALKQAALEAFEGRYEAEEMSTLIDLRAILNQAMELVLSTDLSNVTDKTT